MSTNLSETANPLPVKEASVRRNVIMAIGGFPLMMVMGAVFIIPFIIFDAADIKAGVFATLAAEIIVILIALAVVGNLKNWKNALYLRNFNLKNSLMGFGVGVSLFIILQGVSLLIAKTGGKLEDSDTSAALAGLDGFTKFAILLLIVPIVVPFVEELFFRGFIFGFIKNSRMKNPKTALIIGMLLSSITFGLAHFQGFEDFTDVFVILLTATIGAVNCWLIYKTDSLYTAFACHMGYNLTTSAVVLISMLP